MNRYQLTPTIENHALWIADCSQGQQAVIVGQNLNEIDLTGVNLYGADLSYSTIRNAHLTGANLYHANLFRTSLLHTNLTDADLADADLADADLRHATLRSADLSGACLYESDFRDADLRGADLSGTNTTGTRFFDAQLDGVTMNWKSSELIAERLYQAAPGIDEMMIACFIGRRTGYKWWELKYPGMKWALRTMGGWIKPDDDIPDYLRIPLEPFDDYAYFRKLQESLTT